VSSVAFERASDFSLEEVTRAFNLAFTGYYLPITQTPEGLSGMIEENDIHLSASLALVVDGALAGIGLVAMREERGWIGGMGIGPQLRRQGLGRQLLAHLLSNLRAAGARAVQLEALSVNAPALALYTEMGFRDGRELRVRQGPLRLDGGANTLIGGDESAQVRPVTPQYALQESVHFHQVAPAWQREARTLSRMRHLPSGLGLWQGRHLRAYALYARQPGGYAIYDAGSCESAADTRREQIAALLVHLASGQEGVVARAINTPPGDALDDALGWLGCPVVARQREMVRRLDEP
jgi:ribosomal protein S18 acetylase RimI-like enzyme